MASRVALAVVLLSALLTAACDSSTPGGNGGSPGGVTTGAGGHVAGDGGPQGVGGKDISKGAGW
jgi:hypothetical protein